MSRTIGSTTVSFVWDQSGSLPGVLQDGDGNRYVYGLDLIARTDDSDDQEYYLYDGLGSTAGLADGDGAVTATYEYDAFGNVRSQTGSSPNEFAFTGEQADESGLQYLRARYYDPQVGRFLSQDPVPYLQQYAYVGNNPVNLVDPSGQTAINPNAGRYMNHGFAATPERLQRASLMADVWDCIWANVDMAAGDDFPCWSLIEAFENGLQSALNAAADPLHDFLYGPYKDAGDFVVQWLSDPENAASVVQAASIIVGCGLGLGAACVAGYVVYFAATGVKLHYADSEQERGAVALTAALGALPVSGPLPKLIAAASGGIDAIAELRPVHAPDSSQPAAGSLAGGIGTLHGMRIHLLGY